MNKKFEISTTKEVANEIVAQLAYYLKLDPNYPMILQSVLHMTDYSVVTIDAPYYTIPPDRIFYLGLFCGMNLKRK
ncbi:MAG: hypothetical protein M9888_03905 [Chitinophagales bacterium]|nr:hypothetical protein [Chitinophagales bacterium]